jgi:adenylate cyclase
MIANHAVMKALLKSLDDGHEIHLEDHNIIGRGPQASIRVLDRSVSREHASIQHNASLFWLSDLKSANGTSVNGTGVTTRRALRHGDRIEFGTCAFVFEENGIPKVHGKDTGGISTASLPLKAIKATLLVGDLQNFAGISAQLSASEVADMLREWYDDCEKVLKSRGAIIDKFLGDGVIAYWPAVDPATRLKATEAAKLLSGPAASSLPRRQWLREKRGIEVVCHVGLNVGEVSLGPLVRGINTIVGQTLVITSGIESFTRKLQVPMLAGAALFEGWPEGLPLYQSVGVHTVREKSSPVELFKPVDFPAVES